MGICMGILPASFKKSESYFYREKFYKGSNMKSEIISFIIWTAVFAFTINKSNKNLGALNGRTYKLHIFLAWLLLIIHSTGFKMIGWAIGNPKLISKFFFVSVGPLSAWFNLLTWAGNLVFSIIGIFLSLSLAERKENGRAWVLKLLPILYLFGVTEAIKGFYKDKSEDFTSLAVVASISLVFMAIPFGAIYLFYRRKNVKNQIFTKQIG